MKRKITRFVLGISALFTFGITYLYIRRHPPTEWKINQVYSKTPTLKKVTQTLSYDVTGDQNEVPIVKEENYAILDGKDRKNHAHQKDVGKTNNSASTSTLRHTTKAPKRELPNVKPNTCDLKWGFLGINATHYGRTSIYSNTIPKKKAVVQRIYENPFITLDPDRFLYAVLRWGPNNQLFGFHEAVILSIALNRTVVLPKFITHHRDRQHSMKEISPTHRIDVESLCKFVSCITLDNFQEACNYKIEAILNTKFLKMHDILHIKKFTGMRISTGEGMSSFSTMLFPPNGTSKQNPERIFTVNEAKKLFNIPARCVLYPYPILDLRSYNTKGERVKLHGYVRKKVPPGKMPETDQEMYASVLQHYQRPPYIRKMAAEFVASAMNGQPFISVHWRYNQHDFLSDHHCNVQDTNKKICDRAKSFTAENLAERIIEEIKLLQARKYDVRHIYMAAPPDLFEMLSDVKIFLRKTQPTWKMHTSTELTDFIKFRYKKCEFLMEYYDDIISTTEMEICSLGLEFIGSQGTTWSACVTKSRIFGNITGIRRGFDSLVFAAV